MTTPSPPEQPPSKGYFSFLKKLVIFNFILIFFLVCFMVKDCGSSSKGQMRGITQRRRVNVAGQNDFFNEFFGAMQKDDSKNDSMDGLKMKEKPNVKWDDIIGLEGAKAAIKEAVEAPLILPQAFQNNTKRKPWAGVLLYGPPGTGKSFLAKAAASQVNASFFSISAADIMSRFQGESENRVKRLFEAARASKPSIIFIDEIDSLISQRGMRDENESSRKVKTEFLVQMDGVGKDQAGVLVIAATNNPWSLDEALIRRFTKRIFIGLPDEKSRFVMLKNPFETEKCTVSDAKWKELAQATKGYSGADIAALTNEALYAPVRKILSATHVKRDPNSEDSKPFYFICDPNDSNAIPLSKGGIPKENIRIPEITEEDLSQALASSKPSVNPKMILLYQEWTKMYGKTA